MNLDSIRKVWDLWSSQRPFTGPTLSKLPSPGDPELVVWSEQGLGDSLQFVRYLKLLQARMFLFVFWRTNLLFDYIEIGLSWSSF